ncbi:ATP-dependent RNA helicase HrpA [Thermodesulfobacteriota bacterium]
MDMDNTSNPIIHYPQNLPITGHKEEIIAAIKRNQVVIIAGETGSGKTTQLPKMCLEAGFGRKRKIGCTQPRRIAAITVADRVTEELGASGLALVGHKIRFQDRTGKSTRIKFMTDGILLAESQRDNVLSAYDVVIVDEAHERSLNIDFLLGFLKQLMARRKDIRVIITSATIDTEKFAKNFGGAPVIEVSGRTFPVEVRYHPPPVDDDDGSYIDQMIQAVMAIRQKERPGDILVFMPTERDIRESIDGLEKALRSHNAGRDQYQWPKKISVLPLFGRLAAGDQGKVFRLQGCKIVVATNVAETSVTVPGIRYVVDTGLARILQYNVRARTTKLPVSPISQASADQRKGRCGRVGPGICIRLYDQEDLFNREPFTPPEIIRSNLAEVILRMISLKLDHPKKFPFIDPPSQRAINDGFTLLAEVGAIDGNKRLTRHGRLMARLPLDPRISRMIIEARQQNALREVTVISAALSINDPRIRPAEQMDAADTAHAVYADARSDFLSLLNIWDTFQKVFARTGSRSRMRKFCKTNFLSYQRMREWRDIHEQIWSILSEEKGYAVNPSPADYDAIHRSLLSGNLRNIGLKKEKNIYQGGGGKEMMVFPGSSQFNRAGQWIMAAELVETTRLFARNVAAVKPEWIEPLAGGLCRSTYASPHWEKKRGQVVALEKVTLFGLVIIAGRKVNYGWVKPDECRELFIQSALIEGDLQGHYRFLVHNHQLIEQLQEVEARLRQRDIVVDDSTLYDFYDQRLPRDIRDQAGLNRLLKKRGTDDFLAMTEGDVLNQAPDPEKLSDFPESMTIGGCVLALSYQFDPGSREDGVTLSVPVDLVSILPPERFEWLVPGLLREKVTFLLKGLPKGIRKQLVPLPDTVEKILDSIPKWQGSLYAALERALEDMFQVRISRPQWPAQNLPEPLKMRFSLIDARGKVLQQTREFIELSRKPSNENADDAMVGLRKKWEREGITDWDFAGLPTVIPVMNFTGILIGYGYPSLVPESDSTVALRLLKDPEASGGQTRQGLLILYLNHFRKPKALKKDFSLPRSQWVLYEGLGIHEQFNDDLWFGMLCNVFSLPDGSLPEKEVFDSVLRKVREDGLYGSIKRVYDQVLLVLKERRATMDLISRYETMVGSRITPEMFSDYRGRARMLFTTELLTRLRTDLLQALPRYFKALRIRVERAHVAPAKDIAKAGSVRRFEEFVAAAHNKLGTGTSRTVSFAEKRTLVVEYMQMIEEFKVSLFAQELGRSFRYQKSV